MEDLGSHCNSNRVYTLGHWVTPSCWISDYITETRDCSVRLLCIKNSRSEVRNLEELQEDSLFHVLRFQRLPRGSTVHKSGVLIRREMTLRSLSDQESFVCSADISSWSDPISDFAEELNKVESSVDDDRIPPFVSDESWTNVVSHVSTP